MADIEEDDIILGYPFFKAINSQIDQPMGTTKEAITLLSHNEWNKKTKELEDVNWAKKTMMMQQLAEKAMDKKEQIWQELVSEQYHKYGKVFLKQASK